MPDSPGLTPPSNSAAHEPARPGVAASARASVVALRAAAALSAAVGVLGLLLRWRIEARGLERPAPFRYNVFFHLYHRNEAPFFAVLLCFSLIVLIVALRSPPPGMPLRRHVRPGLVLPAAVAAAVLALTVWGSGAVLHGVPLSMDEFVGDFQARIFSEGRLEAPILPDWRRFAYALRPIYVHYDPIGQTWMSTYLPVYSAIRAAFVRLHAGRWTGPILGALTVLAIFALARRIWPDSPANAALASALLASSSQFLLMSMTAYSMPADLLLNLLWLGLYLDRRPLARGAVPWVGVLAMGLHHPFPHALFATPFLLRSAREKRLRWLAYAALVYAAGTAAWWGWLRHAQPFTRDARFLSLFARPGPSEALLQAAHATLVFSWQSPLVPILMTAAVLAWRRLPAVGRDLAAGLALTFFFYCWFPAGQGHGWGYRYVYGVLGNAVLLAVFGWAEAAEALRGRARSLMAASLAATALIQVPVRCRQAEKFVSPYARALAYVDSWKGRAVIVDPATGWYAQDLIRNDPFLRNDPKVFSAPFVTEGMRRALDQRFPGAVHRLTREELSRLGIPGTSDLAAASPPAAARR